jgi:hypothetical protein
MLALNLSKLRSYAKPLRYHLLQAQQTARLVCAVGLLIGHFLPWAQHKAAALTLHGHDLAIFTNFTPGAGIFLNEWFYCAVWVSGVLWSLSFAKRRSIFLSIIGLWFAFVITSLGFPTYPEILNAYSAPAVGGVDYRLQFYATVIFMGLNIGIFFIARKFDGQGWFNRWLSVGLIVLWLLSIVPIVGFIAVKPFIQTLYNDIVTFGSGWWLSLSISLFGLMLESVFIRINAFDNFEFRTTL